MEGEIQKGIQEDEQVEITVEKIEDDLSEISKGFDENGEPIWRNHSYRNP